MRATENKNWAVKEANFFVFAFLFVHPSSSIQFHKVKGAW
jgi:hypothetical protein